MAPNQEQTEAWNGPESAHYVRHADRYDRQLVPFTEAMLERAELSPHHAVLDVGCGSGAATVLAARRAGRVLGLDISEPLLEVATARARSASVDGADFLVADAQTFDFDGSFDVIISQFGLMFFDDPVAALANLREALTPGGRIVFVSWQGLEANEWLMVLGRELARHAELPALGGLAAGPGMFALKDPDETGALLAAAGFEAIEIEPITPTIVLGGGGGLDDSIEFLFGTGIVRGLLSSVDADARPDVVGRVGDALATHYEEGTGIRLGAAGWLVSAGSR